MEKLFKEQLDTLRENVINRLVELIPFYGEPSEFFPNDNALKCGFGVDQVSGYIGDGNWVKEILYNQLVDRHGNLHEFKELNLVQLCAIADHFDELDCELQRSLNNY